MDRVLLEAARKIENATELDRLWAVFVEAISHYKLTHAIYLTAADTPPLQAEVWSTFQNNWPREEFRDPDFFEPFLAYCCATFEITKVGIEFLSDHTYVGAQSKAYIRNYADRGVRSGLGIPCRLRGTGRHGGFVLGNTQDRFRFERQVFSNSGGLQSFCLIAHRRIEDLQNNQRVALEMKPLSARERQTLTLIARGQRPKQISHLLGVSVSSVRLYLKNARAKLGAHTKEEAVVRMLEFDRETSGKP